MCFDFTPILSDRVVSIDQLEPADLEPLFTIASDKNLWAGHPKKDRYQRPVFEQWFEEAIASNHALKIFETKTGAMIGSSRYYEYDALNKEIAIGYTFIGTAYWGGEINKRVKNLMLNHAFKTVDKVWLHVDPSNIRSQKAVLKLGATFTHLEEKEGEAYECYEIPKQVWLRQT